VFVGLDYTERIKFKMSGLSMIYQQSSTKRKKRIMEIEVVRNQLRQLKLSTASSELEEVISRTKRAVSLDWLSRLLEREIDARKESSLRTRLQTAKIINLPRIFSFT
jgi:hypothetical protein